MSKYMVAGVDPVGISDVKNQVRVVYFESLESGVNCNNKAVIRSATLKGYAKEINEQHRLRNLPPPFNLRDKKQPITIIIDNLSKEENIARRRKPLTKQMAARLISHGKEAHKLSKEALIKDITIINREMGCRAAEMVQTKSGEADVHEYLSGRKVIKSISRSWFKCYDKRGQLVRDPVKQRDRIQSVMITWLIQKNRRNGEECWYEKNKECTQLCVIEAIVNMFERAKRLGQSNDLPLAV